MDKANARHVYITFTSNSVDRSTGWRLCLIHAVRRLRTDWIRNWSVKPSQIRSADVHVESNCFSQWRQRRRLNRSERNIRRPAPRPACPPVNLPKVINVCKATTTTMTTTGRYMKRAIGGGVVSGRRRLATPGWSVVPGVSGDHHRSSGRRRSLGGQLTVVTTWHARVHDGTCPSVWPNVIVRWPKSSTPNSHGSSWVHTFIERFKRKQRTTSPKNTNWKNS